LALLPPQARSSLATSHFTRSPRTATGDVDLNAGFRLQHLGLILTRFRGRVKLAGALALRHPRRRLHIPAARAGLVTAPPGGSAPSPGGAPQPRHRRRPAPPRRPRPSARHRRLPGRRRAARSRGPLRTRDAPVADAHRPAVLLRRSLAATAPAASGGPSIRPWRCSGRPAPGARS
jgi:hypothetical protein